MAEYLLVADRGYDPDQITAMFVEDSTWEGDGFGRHVGKQAIWKLFKDFSGTLVFAAHFVTNPIITFERPDRARGVWRLLEPATVNTAGGLESSLLVAAYDNGFVKVDGAWKFKSVLVHVNFFEPINKGWAHSAKA
jgi:SnoaL-like domain